MPDIFDEVWGRRLTRGEIAQLLLLKERALDRKITKDLEGLSEEDQRRIIWDLASDDEEPAARERSFLERWGAFKKRVLSIPGAMTARLVRRYASHGGKHFCLKIRYCPRRAWLERHLESLKHIEAENAYASRYAIDKLREQVPEMLEYAQEVLGVLADACGDYVVPGSLCVKVVKYGLDETCPCCKPCKGEGWTKNRECGKCGGSGLETPFPA